MSGELFVITISHQIGSGGAYVGQKIAERLGIPFVDREILKQVAEELNLAEAELARREERVRSFWQRFANLAALTDPTATLTADHYRPTDKELFQLESDIIQRIAGQNPAVFLGRSARYILRDHPQRLSLLVHAALPARVARLRALYGLSEAAATRMAESNDRERAAYIRAFTREDWLDASLYDLCIDTSTVGLETAVGLVCASVAAKIRSESGPLTRGC